MKDAYREYIRSMSSSSWALVLFGPAQLANLLSLYDARQPTRKVETALDAVTCAIERQYDDPIRACFLAGDQLQKTALALMLRSLPHMAPTWRGLTKMVFSMMQQSAEVCSMVMPGRDSRLAWQELTNKLQAFDVFEHVDLMFDLPTGSVGIETSLLALLEKADALGPYRTIWAMEGLGRYYAKRVWERQGMPRHLLTVANVGVLPSGSLIPLHTGMGLSFAECLLKAVKPGSADTNLGVVLRQFVTMCQTNSREGYAGAALEALGLVTRLLYPQMVRVVDQQLSSIDPGILGYFWHGVGRGIYFLPTNALPCANLSWHTLEMSQGEAPHTLGQLNTLAGLAWALTLVNIRNPEILENVLKQYRGSWSESNAFANGVSAAVLIWYDMKPDDPYLRAFCRYQPDPSDRHLVQLWQRQVQEPCQEALQKYHSVLKEQGGLGEVFRYQSLAELVDRLNKKPRPWLGIKPS